MGTSKQDLPPSRPSLIEAGREVLSPRQIFGHLLSPLNSFIRTMILDVCPPAGLAEPIHVPLKTLAGPGPSNVSDRVLQAQALPTLGHLHPEFCKIMDDIKSGVQYIFQTNNTMTLALSATGHAAMECVMTNMLEPGRTVLIANNCLLAVDTVASLGGTPLQADVLEIDVIYTGSQKTLGVPPGTAPISFSPKAVAAFKSRTKPPCSFYLDLEWLGQYWNCWPDKGRIYHHTGPVNSLYGLREGLALVSEEGLENVWRRHRLCADYLQTGIKDLGLEMFVPDAKARLPTVNTIKIPDGINWQAVPAFCMKNHLVEISGGLGPSAGKVWRIGVMGNNANVKTVSKVLDALKKALADQGWKGAL